MLNLFKRSPRAEHEYCQESLSPFLDGQLAPHEQARVERHLQGCSDCRADLATLRRTVALLHAVPSLKPPRSFYIPATEGVRQRQVQRARVAYGYVQFATAVAGVLLVLVVSGDALLRLGGAGPARQAQAPVAEPTALYRGEDTAAPEVMPTMAPAMLGAPSAPALGAAPGTTGTPQTVTDAEQVPKAAPSQTSARAAASAPLPTVTQESSATAPQAAELAQPSSTPVPEANLMAVPPTALPEPTETPVMVAALPPPQPVAVEAERHVVPSRPAAPAGLLAVLQPLLPWFELILALAIVVGVVVMIWMRGKRPPV